MHFSTILATLAFAGAALAQQDHKVIVGLNETLTFTPNNVTGAVSGDTITFFL